MAHSKIDSDDRQPNDEAEESVDEEGRESIAEFLSQFSGGSHQFIINRLEPKVILVRGQEKRVAGHLATLHSAPSLEDIRERWRGGLYEIRVMSRVGGKGPRIVACRKVEIAGDPKLQEDETAPPVAQAPSPLPASASPELIQRVLDHTFDDKRRAEERLERERQRAAEAQQQRPPVQEPAMWETTVGAIQQSARDQMQALHYQLERRDKELAELRQHVEGVRGKSSPLENPEFLKVLFSRNTDDSVRVTDNYRHEVQLERERHQREIESERERHQRDIESERERRERELDAERREHGKSMEMIERLHRSEVENLRTAQLQLLATKDEHIARLNEDVRQARTSNRPSDTLSDLQRMGQVVSAVREFVPGLAGEAVEQVSGWEKLMERAQPLLEKVVETVARPQPVPMIPMGGRMPLAGLVPMTRRPLSPMRRARPPAPVASPPDPPATTTEPASLATAGGESAQPMSSTVVQGLEYLETAFQNHRTVDEVARSALSLFPKAELAALGTTGADVLCEEIEKRSPESLLLSHGGRKYLRELLEALESQTST